MTVWDRQVAGDGRVVIVMIALLYYVAPNARLPGFRWISPAALLAVVIWVVASAAFGFYVANFGSYNKTYGTLGGAISLLVWLWISNLAVLFGRRSSTPRSSASASSPPGLPAERDLQLEPRDAPKDLEAKGVEASRCRPLPPRGRGRGTPQTRG